MAKKRISKSREQRIYEAARKKDLREQARHEKRMKYINDEYFKKVGRKRP